MQLFAWNFSQTSSSWNLACILISVLGHEGYETNFIEVLNVPKLSFPEMQVLQPWKRGPFQIDLHNLIWPQALWLEIRIEQFIKRKCFQFQSGPATTRCNRDNLFFSLWGTATAVWSQSKKHVLMLCVLCMVKRKKIESICLKCTSGSNIDSNALLEKSQM